MLEVSVTASRLGSLAGTVVLVNQAERREMRGNCPQTGYQAVCFRFQELYHCTEGQLWLEASHKEGRGMKQVWIVLSK